jgi:hypothetical protein
VGGIYIAADYDLILRLFSHPEFKAIDGSRVLVLEAALLGAD